MNYEVRNKYISAGATAFCLAVLLVFLLLCGFTHKTPPDPPAEEIVVEVQEVELFDDAGGGNMMDGGNYNPNNPKPAPEVKNQTPTKQNTSSSNTATSNTGPKTNVSEQQKINNNAIFGSDKVHGGTKFGKGGANGHDDGLGYGNAWGNGGGSNGGVGSGKWKKIPDFSDLSCDKDFYIEFKCTVDDKGSVSNAVKVNDSGAPASLVSEVKRKILSEAKYSAGSPGEITVGITLKKN